MLASGRPVPPPGEPLQRGEGVALVLSGLAVRAWREAGEQYRMHGVRGLSQSDYKPAGNRVTLSMCCHVMRQQEQPAEQRRTSFFDDFQQALSSILSNQPYVILGDFNARVGSRETDDDPWFNVRGPHGYGESNDAGKELLAFLETYVALVYLVREERHQQTDMAAPQIKAVHGTA